MTNNMIKKGTDNLYHKTAYLYTLDPRPILTDDLPFYLEYAEKADGDVLDLAAGTGRVSIPLADAGHEVWALDLSDTMLEQLGERVKTLDGETQARIHPVKGDMTTFDLGRKFSLIIVPFRAFQALLTEKDRQACLRSVYRHLDAKGRFIITYVKPMENMAKDWIDPTEHLSWEAIDPHTGNRVRKFLVRKDINLEKQWVYADEVYYTGSNDGTESRVVESSCIHYDYEDNIRQLLAGAGFKVEAACGYYDGTPIGEGSEYIFICTR